MSTSPNSDVKNDDEIKDVADKLGIDIEDNDNGKEEKESDSSKKTDTEIVEEESRNDNSEKKDSSSDEDPVDYKAKYAASTKEFQDKYKPLEDSVDKLEKLSGKNIVELLEDFSKSSEEQIESKDKTETEKDSPNVDNEVNEKLSTFEERLSNFEGEMNEQKERNLLTAKDKVKSFRDEYGISEDDYSKKYQPFLSGIKEMKKENGDPYTLEEALKMSYVLANRDNIEKIVDTKMQIREREKSLSIAPDGAKQTSSSKTIEYSDAQHTAAKGLGISLKEKEEE